MKKFKIFTVFVIFLILIATHAFFLYKIVIKHNINSFYFVLYFVIYISISIYLLLRCDLFCKINPASALLFGCICGCFLSFISLAITDAIFIDAFVIRWRMLFMMSNFLLMGWCYFPFLIFISRCLWGLRRGL